MDSGASGCVALEGAVHHVKMVDSRGIRNGVTYEVAKGEVIDNLGQKTVWPLPGKDIRNNFWRSRSARCTNRC